jgi:glycosyltransferase involved in cell wall biosynthesis
MPIFNGARYLSEALESVQKQTYTNLEILLINDGSTDSSAEIVERFAQSEKRAVVVNKQNTGLIDTLNFGLNAANGCWIARLDQDDIAHPIRIERQVAALSQYEDTVLVGSDFITLNDDNLKTKRYRLPSSHDRLIRRLRRMQNFFPHSSAMFRTDIALSIGGYDYSAIYNEDWDLWLRLSERGRVTSVQENLVTVRKHRSQMTRNSGSIIPSGEAFISTVMHFMRYNPNSNRVSSKMKPEELRAKIRSTDAYLRFCEVSCLQQRIGDSLAGGKVPYTRPIRLFSQLIYEPRTLSALSYAFFGTSSAGRLAKTPFCSPFDHANAS